MLPAWTIQPQFGPLLSLPALSRACPERSRGIEASIVEEPALSILRVEDRIEGSKGGPFVF